ncbi:MAG: helix-turn-helix domain-containing protein [Leptolyngbya sp. BL-A-14]
MKELDATQVEQLKTIGAYLGRERKARGVTLEEIAVKTYIPLRLLQALEEGRVERLPEPVFVQGFIRRFADTIGLDGLALAKTFSPEPSFGGERAASDVEHPPVEGRPLPNQPITETPKSKPETIVNSVVEPISIPSEFIQRGTPPAKRSFLPWVVLGTAAVLLLGVGVVNVLNRPKPTLRTQNAETSVTGSKPVSPAPQSTVSLSPAPASPPASNSPSSNASAQPDALSTPNPPIQVAVNLTDESWFQVTADGKPEFEGILKKGEQKTWTAKKKLVLQAGNAGAVSVSYNQGEAKRLGELGEVKDVTFSSNGEPKTDSKN